VTAPRGSRPPIEDLIDDSTLGTEHAVEMRRVGGIAFNVRLTGMDEEQADWDSDDDQGGAS
jgi:hypothetical protein